MNTNFNLSQKLQAVHLRLIASGMITGIVLYIFLIPLESIFVSVRIVATGVDLAMDPELAMRGAWTGVLSLSGVVAAYILSSRFASSRLSRVNHESDRLTRWSVASGLVIALLGLPVSGLFAGAFDLRAAQTANTSSYLTGLHSLLMMNMACLCGLLVGSCGFTEGSSSKWKRWLVWMMTLGGIGFLAGDKNILGSGVLGLVFGLASQARTTPRMLAISVVLASIALIASGPVNTLKYWLYGVSPDSWVPMPPSRLDPSTPFVLTVASWKNMEEIGVSSFDSSEAILADISILVPRVVGADRGKSGALVVAEELMGKSYFEGAGYGYSPYIDLIAALGPWGAFLSAFTLTALLLICHRVLVTVLGPAFGLLSAGLLASLAVFAHRMTLFGAAKACIYSVCIVIACGISGIALKGLLANRVSRIHSKCQNSTE